MTTGDEDAAVGRVVIERGRLGTTIAAVPHRDSVVHVAVVRAAGYVKAIAATLINPVPLSAEPGLVHQPEVGTLACVRARGGIRPRRTS